MTIRWAASSAGLTTLCVSATATTSLHASSGEQSGHIILSKYASTGDGILTSLKMMEVMLAKKLPMSKLAEPLKIYPQLLENVRVTDKKVA